MIPIGLFLKTIEDQGHLRRNYLKIVVNSCPGERLCFSFDDSRDFDYNSTF